MAKIAFVQENLVEKLGVMSIAAVLKKHGHQCEVFCYNAEKDCVAAIVDYKPDLVGCGVTTYEYLFGIDIMGRIKKADSNIITIMGGHHPTVSTDTIYQECVDIICRGEGELSVLELMDRIDKGEDYSDIAGLWVKKSGKVFENPLRAVVENLNELPFMDRGIYYDKYKQLRALPTKSFITSRGCPYRCSFCFNNVYAEMFKDKGSYLRYVDPENVIKEIKQVKEKYGLEWVAFHDSTFNSNRPYLEKLLRGYIKNKDIPGFICNVRADGLDEDSVSLMRSAGCDKVTIGVQHGNEGIRKKLANRGGDQSDDKIIKACKLLKEHGIRVYTDFIVGWPGETTDEAFESVHLARRIKPAGVNSFLMMPLPGTDIQKYAVKYGYLNPNVGMECFIKNLSEGYNDNKAAFDQANIKELINIQKLFYFAVSHPRLEPLVRLLIKLPPNKVFSFIHGLPNLKRALKYDKKTFNERVVRIIEYTNEICKVKA